MADLVAANLTVHLATLNTAAGDDFKMRDIIVRGHKKEVHCVINFGDGALKYPTGGIPIPGFASFFLVRNLENIALIDTVDTANLLIWRYNRVNSLLRAYQSTTGAPAALVEFTNTALVATLLYAIAFGW